MQSAEFRNYAIQPRLESEVQFCESGINPHQDLSCIREGRVTLRYSGPELFVAAVRGGYVRKALTDNLDSFLR